GSTSVRLAKLAPFRSPEHLRKHIQEQHRQECLRVDPYWLSCSPNRFKTFQIVSSGYPFHSAKTPLAIRSWRGLQAAASRLRSPEVTGHFRGPVKTAGACGARSKTHSPLISSRLTQRRECPAPTVGVGHARLFATTRAKSSLGNVAWFSLHFCGP